MTTAREVQIPVGDFEISASLHGQGQTAILLGHGAGGSRRTPALVKLADGLAETGRLVLLYNFRYAELGRRAPDRPEVLERTVRAVGDYASALRGVSRIVHGGRSMGGRIASQVVAQGRQAAALFFLAYPLHPPGKPERLRDAHLSAIELPMLFVQGTRDAFARPDLLRTTLARLGERATCVAIADGDHSFKVTKRSGRDAKQVEAEIQSAILSWLEQLAL